jgi:recA bacterial DNA recombination protein
MNEDLVEQIKRVSKTAAELEERTPAGYFNTGNVMLNLALTERWNWGFGRGKITNLIGGSFIGKSVQVKGTFAELAYDSNYDEYDLVDDDVEYGTGLDIKKMFGQKTADRIIPPRAGDTGEPLYSDTVEDFLDSIYKLLQGEKPFLYALDTYDSLTDRDEKKMVTENIRIREKMREGGEGTKLKEKDSYGQDKNRELNRTLRLIKSKLQQTASGLIIVSQVRDNIGATVFEPKFRRTGGKALKHYSWHEIWLAHIKDIERGVEGRERKVGAWVRAIVTKNRTTGKLRNTEFPIYYDYGVDNIEACIEFLIKEKFWKKDGTKISSDSLGLKGKPWPTSSGAAGRIETIKEVEGKNLERKLYREAQRAWLEIEESLNVERKPKYEE